MTLGRRANAGLTAMVLGSSTLWPCGYAEASARRPAQESSERPGQELGSEAAEAGSEEPRGTEEASVPTAPQAPAGTQPSPDPGQELTSDSLRLQQVERRAEARMNAGDFQGALERYGEALELVALTSAGRDAEARIRIQIVAVHAALGENGSDLHAATAERLARQLLDERKRLELSEEQVKQLEAWRGPEKTKTRRSSRNKQSLVEEKVLESEVLSDRKMISTGTTLTSIAIGFGLAGGVLLNYAGRSEESLSEFKIPDQEVERRRAIRSGTSQNAVGITFVVLAGVFVVSGVTLIAVGTGRKRKRLGRTRRARKDNPKVSATIGRQGIGVNF